MIRFPERDAGITPAERWAVTVLVDLSGVLPAEPQAREAVRLTITEDGPTASGARQERSPGEWLARDWDVEACSGEVRVPRGVLRLCARVCGASAEQRSGATDRHGRVPSAVNELVSAGLERVPLISQLARAIRAAACRAAGRGPFRTIAPWPNGRRWAVALTHDLDVVAWWPLFTALRAVELVRHRRGRDLLRVLAAASRAAGSSPVWQGVAGLLEMEDELQVPSTWFILSGTPTPATMLAGDLTYRPESPLAQRILGAVSARGDEIGLHGSFATMLSASELSAQRDRLSALTGRSVAGVRQHFLRLRPGGTQRAMAAAGFRYDASFGFPDRGGFRLGIADVVPAWDDEREEAMPLDLVPLSWMDRTLSKYQGIDDPARWVDEGLALAGECRAVDGLWVGLWHPNLTGPLGYPGAPAAYRRLLAELAGGEPWFATLGDVVAWRAARRAVRATAVSSDGARVTVEAGDGPHLHEMLLYDQEGRACERLSATELRT